MTVIIRKYIAFLLLSTVLVGVINKPADAEQGEYQVKAAMIFNMLRFMDWPEETVSASATKINVCVAGKGSLAASIDVLHGKQIKGKTFYIQQLNTQNSFSGCNVLVIGDLDKSTTAGIIERTKSISLVTVADSPGFARSGGVVGLIIQNGKVRFEVNTASAQRHKIRISSQLLKLAQIVQEAP